MSFGGGNSGGGQSISKMDPYDPAKPALNQIISESGSLYNQGVKAAGYVAPSQQTTQGLAAQELMGTAANQQLADTLSGKYLNPFLSPMLQGAGNAHPHLSFIPVFRLVTYFMRYLCFKNDLACLSLNRHCAQVLWFQTTRRLSEPPFGCAFHQPPLASAGHI